MSDRAAPPRGGPSARFAPPGGILLAAGAGSRFGGPKALVELEGRLLVEWGADLLGGAGLDPRVVVLGADADAVRAAADLGGVQVVEADGWAAGQSVSVRAGLRALAVGTAPAAVVALVDQPLVTPTAVRRLVRRWRAGAEVVAATYAGELRTPVLFDRSVWAEVDAALEGDRGAGAWLRAHPDRVTGVEVADVADAVDVDAPADLAAVRARLRPV